MPEKNASVTRAAAAPAAAVSPSDLLSRFIALEWREPGRILHVPPAIICVY